MTSTVPTLDQLDAATLTDLLGKTVTSVRAESLGTSTGFLGRLQRLHLTYDEAGPPGPKRLVAKAPTDDAGGREVGRMLNVWARESRFFAELAPSLGGLVPGCYANLGDPRTDRWLLLLSDAGDSVAADQSSGATFDQARAALQALAQLHRRFDERPNEWLPGFDRGPLTALQQAVESAVEPFLARYGDGLPQDGADLLMRFAPRLSVWSEQQAQGPLCLVHADFRLDNLVFTDRGEVVILDWQTALMGGAEMDVASLLTTSLAVSDRRRWEDELIAGYADARGHTVADVRERYRHYLLWWMALYANNLSRIDPGDPRGSEMFNSTIERTFCAALDHEVGDLIG